VPNFRYRALTQGGKVVSGSISAPKASEVARRIEYLGLVPIDTVTEGAQARVGHFSVSIFNRPQPEDVTVFTYDLALLLKAGARVEDALELLSTDVDIGRLRPTVGRIRSAIMAGESFADAIAQHQGLFPPMYVALVRVGEASGTLDHILEVLAVERTRNEAARRKVLDALRYPIFVLIAATCVLLFFLLAVLPQFAAVLRDFGTKLDPIVATFLSLSDFIRANTAAIAAAVAVMVPVVFLIARRPRARALIGSVVSRLPGIRSVTGYHRTALFCRNLGVLLEGGVLLATSLRILVDMMANASNIEAWSKVVDRVRHGGKLTDALTDVGMISDMAVRMLRLGEETGQLPLLAGRVAEFYEAKLQRSLDRVVGIVGPAAIITISVVVGGLIISVMTALLSVSQIVG
jgi:general secretion pathway protein F